MEYTEHAPRPALASFVRCIWTLEGEAAELGNGVQPILPDGRPELVMHLGDAFERVYPDGSFERQPAVLFAGQLRRALELRATGRIAMIGVRFHPDGAAALLKEPQHELTGLTIGVDALSVRLARSLNEVRDSALSLIGAADAVEEQLTRRIGAARLDPRVRSAVEAIERARGRVVVEELASELGLTPRHLERRFKTCVGLPPKRLARIARFQHALRVLEGMRAPARGTRTAMMCGYADQAHFVREFRELAGCAPGAHILRRAQLTGFFEST